MNREARTIFFIALVLVMFGIVMVYSSSAVYAYGKYGESSFFIKKHLGHLALGALIGLICAMVPPMRLKDLARPMLAFSVFLLVLVLIPGLSREIGGVHRWFKFFGYGIQPSEIAKIVLVIYLADFTTRKRYLMQNFGLGFLPAFTIIVLVSGLVLLEPDMGSFILLMFLGFAMLFVAGASVRHLMFIVLSSLPLICALILIEPYRLKRILAFLNPWQDARGTGFQIIQSFIALGSGGFFGVGLGESKQKLFYLPESYTDFMFSIIGEELGFLGTIFVLVLFASLIWHSLRISAKLNDIFASRVVFGLGILIAFEVIINISVTTGLMPTKGLPLPFISYGGSSLVSHLALIGLMVGMAKRIE